MTKKQLSGLVDSLTTLCTFKVPKYYSMSIEKTEWEDYFSASILLFPANGIKAFNSSDISMLLGVSLAFNVTLYFETVHGVTVAKFL